MIRSPRDIPQWAVVVAAICLAILLAVLIILLAGE
jgi:hypothetical protein